MTRWPTKLARVASRAVHTSRGAASPQRGGAVASSSTSAWKRVRYVLVLVALCSIATCPAARRSCVARQRAREADELLGYLADRVAREVASTGAVPPLAAGPTPMGGCCDQSGGACVADPQVWDSPGWHALGFAIDGPYRYTYTYAPEPGGASAVLRATADLDCDGNVSTYELRLVVVGRSVERAWTRREP